MGTDPQVSSVWTVFGNRWVKLVVLVGSVVAVGYLVYVLRNILVPFGLAVTAAYILNPLVVALGRKLHLSRTAAALLLLGGLALAALGALVCGICYAAVSVREAVPAAQRALAAAQGAGGTQGSFEAALRSIPNAIRIQIENVITDLPATIGASFGTISKSVLGGVGVVLRALLGFVLGTFSFVLFFVVTAYLLIDLIAFRDAVEALLPVRFKDEILRVAGRIDRDVQAFYRGQVLVALALGVVYSVGLVIAGVDFGLLIGAAAGLASIVPYLGLAVGFVPALLLALVPYHGLFAPLAVVATFVGGQMLDGMFLTPRIIGRNVGLHPVVVILSVMVFGTLLGFLGVIFAVPLAAATKVLLGELAAYYRRLQAPSPSAS